MLRIIYVILFCAATVRLETTEDIVSSGEVPYPATINDAGDNTYLIAGIVYQNQTNTTVFDFSNETETTFQETNETNLETTTLGTPTTLSTSTTLSTTTTLSPSTTTAVESTTTPSTTTEQTTTTTEMPTTTQSTTPSTEATTTSSPSTTQKKVITTRPRLWRPTTLRPTRKSTVLVSPSPSAEESINKDFIGKQCTFSTLELLCDVKIICYGEGEIDCSDVSGETSVDDEESDYEEDDLDTDDATEIHRVRRVPTEPSHPESTTTTPEDFKVTTNDTTDSEAFNTLKETNDTTDSETFNPLKETNDTTDSEAFNPLKETNDTTVSEAINPLKETNDTTDSEVFNTLKDFDVASTQLNDKELVMENYYFRAETNERKVTEAGDIIENDKAAIHHPDRKQIFKKYTGKLVSKDNETSSKELLPHALESSKPTKGVKTCKITGNLKCKPVPTVGICKGRTNCQVLESTDEKENTKTAKGMENWIIAIIAIGALIFAALCVTLTVWLLVRICKKSKVKPENDVTTLTYVNNTPL